MNIEYLSKNSATNNNNQLPYAQENMFSNGWRLVGYFLYVHAIVDVAYAVHVEGPTGLHEALWVCSCTLHMAAIAMVSPENAPMSLASCIIAVVSAHTGWIVETASSVLLGRELAIGLISYVNRDGEHTFLSVYTQTHHLWFLVRTSVKLSIPFS